MEQQIKCAVFDLDGTLINTITDLGNACDFLIGKYGFCAHWSEDDYKRFVGNGNRKLVERAFSHSLNEETLEKYLVEFKEYYNVHMLDNTNAYDGITQQLKTLKDMGIKLCVVTNKAEPEAIEIIQMILILMCIQILLILIILIKKEHFYVRNVNKNLFIQKIIYIIINYIFNILFFQLINRYF